MKTILKYKFLLSIAVFSIFTILSCNTTNQNKATTISLDSMNAIYTRDSINAIADYDTEFLGEPLKDSVMQHNRNVLDRKSTRLNSSHSQQSRMPSSA